MLVTYFDLKDYLEEKFIKIDKNQIILEKYL